MKNDDRLEIPRFASEEEEAQWWYEHREETAQFFEEAVTDQRTTTLAALLEKKRQGGPTPTVAVQIDPADVERARAQAQRRGLRYETYLKMALHEALEREDQRVAG